MRPALVLILILLLASCQPEQPPSGPGAAVPHAHQQDSTRCALEPEDPFCEPVE